MISENRFMIRKIVEQCPEVQNAPAVRTRNLDVYHFLWHNYMIDFSFLQLVREMICARKSDSI